MKNVTKLQFWPAQKAFFEWGPSPCLFMGGVGAGKTWVGILKMLYLLDMYPGSRGAIVRQRANQLRATTAKTLWKLLPTDKIANRNINAGEVTLVNGSQIILRHLDKENSIEDLKSLELNFAYVDQMEDVSAYAWDTLLERLGRWSGALMRGGFPKDWPYKDRLGNPIPPTYAFASAYSPGYDHWITSRFWSKGKDRERYAAEGYQVFIGSTRENKALTQDYVDKRLARGKEYVERFVDAVVWGANEGLIFEIPEASLVHATADILTKIRRTMRIHRTYDHGDSSPSACLWSATDTDNNIIFYMEYQKENQLISEHRRNIYNLSMLDTPSAQGLPYYYSNWADPKIFTKDRGRTATLGPTHSVADEWLDRRIMEPETAVAWRRADNNESMTVNRVKEYLRVDPNHRNPFTGEMGAPHMYFIMSNPDHPHGCREVIAQLRSARRELAGYDDDGNKLYKDKRDDSVVDHLTDCVRYFTGIRPALAIKQERIEDVPGTIRMSDYDKLIEEEEFNASLPQIQDMSDYGY